MILNTVLDFLDIKSCLLFFGVLLLVADILKNKNPPNFPPGPWSLPFLGNIFTSLDFKTISKLAEKHGSVFSLRWGRQRTVYVSGYKMVREALVGQGENVAERPEVPMFHKVFKGLGLTMSNGKIWRRQRKFANTHLKHFGEGRKTLESHIMNECKVLCEALSEENGRPFDPQFTISHAVANVICSLVFGHRFEYSDARLQNALRLDAECAYLAGTTRAQLYDAFPRLLEFLPGPHQTVHSNYAKIMAFLKEEIEKHREDWDPSDPRDYVDSYFSEMEKMKNDTEAGFNAETLVVCTLDLFEAGTETVSTTMRWALLLVMYYPDVQEKVQAEIDRVIGSSRQPTMADRVNMPYTDAVIHETQRFGNIAPLGFPKMTGKVTKLGAYTLPKATLVITNLSSVLKDRNEWETPDTFNPAHFLDSQGQFRKREAFLPFSAGKRACLGEQLARMDLFLFFTSLLQRFTFSPPPGVELSLEGQLGFTHSPKAFQMCAVPR